MTYSTSKPFDALPRILTGICCAGSSAAETQRDSSDETCLEASTLYSGVQLQNHRNPKSNTDDDQKTYTVGCPESMCDTKLIRVT